MANTFWSQIGDFFQPVGDWISDRVDDVGNWITDITTSDSWDSFLNGSANKVNEGIAEANLNYQRERNEIEDIRYAEERDFNRAFANEEQAWQRAFANEEQAYQRAWANEEQAYNRMFANEEQAYNRAFAKEQQEYDRALQERLFEREDTALERQAQSLSAMGINPLTVNMNGLGAGQAIQSSLSPVATSGSSTAPSSISTRGASAPNSSNRGGQALLNRFQRFSKGAAEIVQPIQAFAKALQDYSIGNIQRDSLALQNDRQLIENKILAHENGFDYYSNRGSNDLYGSVLRSDIEWNGQKFDNDWEKTKGFKQRKQADELREIDHKKSANLFDSDPELLKNIKIFANEDYEKILDNVLTNSGKIGSMLLNLLK